MVRGVNKVVLIGNLGQDPELNYTGSGTAVCNLRLATNESYKDNNGELVERTEWHDIVAWARLAEICDQYLEKGSKIYAEGSLQTRSWEDRDGNTRYSTEVKMREMMMLGGEEKWAFSQEKKPAPGSKEKTSKRSSSSRGKQGSSQNRSGQTSNPMKRTIDPDPEINQGWNDLIDFFD